MQCRVAIAITLSLFVSSVAAAAVDCDQTKRNEVLAPRSEAFPDVLVDCNLTLQPGDVVTKMLLFRGEASSGVTLDCRGATITDQYRGDIAIMLKTRRFGDDLNATWQPLHDVTLKNCNVIGSVRLMGMSKNGNSTDGPWLKASSYQAGHTQRAQDAAPRNITLDNMHITGTAGNVLYIGPGVTYFNMSRSVLDGRSSAQGLYLDAESAHNTFRNNTFSVAADRQQIAIDGSARNRFFGNRIADDGDGAIHMFRNCGENGTSRHQGPQHNQIINNVFVYANSAMAIPPAYIVVGSRGDEPLEHNWLWNFDCNEDNASDYGSGINNASHAKWNVIMQNQFYRYMAGATTPISNGSDGNSTPNYFWFNTTVMPYGELHREAGCYSAEAYHFNFVPDGGVFDVLSWVPLCGTSKMCNDGELVTTTTACSVQTVGFECSIYNKFHDCQKTVSCPAGTVLVGVRAACNLEINNSVFTSDVYETEFNTLRVDRASDVASDGRCWVGPTSTSTSTVTMTGFVNRTSLSYGCREKDSNGADCQIRGEMYCRAPVGPYYVP